MDNDLPAFGEFDGKRISREDAEKLPPDQKAEVVFDVPGVGKVRPWRFAVDGSAVKVSGKKITF